MVNALSQYDHYPSSYNSLLLTAASKCLAGNELSGAWQIPKTHVPRFRDWYKARPSSKSRDIITDNDDDVTACTV